MTQRNLKHKKKISPKGTSVYNSFKKIKPIFIFQFNRHYFHIPKKLKAMKEEISLFIDKPCNEQWSKMENVEGGKFCDHCNKTVIDFTSFTNDDLRLFFKFNSEKICGRIKTESLKGSHQIFGRGLEERYTFGEMRRIPDSYYKKQSSLNPDPLDFTDEDF